MTVTGTAVALNGNYGTDGLWPSSLAFPNFRAVRECSTGLVGIDGNKLVVMSVGPDVKILIQLCVNGIAEFDLGGTLLEPAIAGEDRNGWIFSSRSVSPISLRVRSRKSCESTSSGTEGTLDPALGTNGLVTLKVDGYATAPAGFTLHDGTILEVALSRTIPMRWTLFVFLEWPA